MSRSISAAASFFSSAATRDFNDVVGNKNNKSVKKQVVRVVRWYIYMSSNGAYGIREAIKNAVMKKLLCQHACEVAFNPPPLLALSLSSLVLQKVLHFNQIIIIINIK